MNVPNWIHHSKKDKKIVKKPRQLAMSRARLQALKRKLRAKRSFRSTVRTLACHASDTGSIPVKTVG